MTLTRVDAGPRFGARLRRRRGHDGAPAARAGAHGIEWTTYLLAAAVAHLRCRRRALARALHRRRPGRAHASRAPSRRSLSAGATVDSLRKLVRRACAGGTSVRGRWSRTTRVRSKATSLAQLSTPATSSRPSLRVSLDVVQPLQRQAQRHRLLLHLTSSRRARRRHRRLSPPSPRSADGTAESDGRILTLIDARLSALSGSRRFAARSASGSGFGLQDLCHQRIGPPGSLEPAAWSLTSSPHPIAADARCASHISSRRKDGRNESHREDARERSPRSCCWGA